MKKRNYNLKSKILVYPGMGAWRFLILDKIISAEIKENFGKNVRGWGSLRVEVTIGKTIWNTSIFPDKKSGTYLLPLKAKVRKAEEIFDDDTVSFSFKLI
tara:strand:- start:400 stop:699 length:300 start_codon:yes stop_codon:yes gene_type:complete